MEMPQLDHQRVRKLFLAQFLCIQLGIFALEFDWYTLAYGIWKLQQPLLLFNHGFCMPLSCLASCLFFTGDCSFAVWGFLSECCGMVEAFGGYTSADRLLKRESLVFDVNYMRWTVNVHCRGQVYCNCSGRKSCIPIGAFIAFTASAQPRSQVPWICQVNEKSSREDS